MSSSNTNTNTTTTADGDDENEDEIKRYNNKHNRYNIIAVLKVIMSVFQEN